MLSNTDDRHSQHRLTPHTNSKFWITGTRSISGAVQRLLKYRTKYVQPCSSWLLLFLRLSVLFWAGCCAASFIAAFATTLMEPSQGSCRRD